MSDANILIGYIEEALPTYQNDPNFFQDANDAVLSALPLDDTWPPLCRAMFSTTGHDAFHGSFRRRRLVHFAGHFNSFGEQLPEWLGKFESLLRQIYWLRAEVYLLHTWSFRSSCISYEVTPETVRQYMADNPRPPSTWKLTGWNVNLVDPEPDHPIRKVIAHQMKGSDQSR